MTRYLWHEATTTLEATVRGRQRGDVFDFDDGYASHLAAGRLVARFERQATFYLVTRWIGLEGFLTWRDVEELVELGHAIGNHTTSHVWLGKIPAVARRLEIRDAQDEIADRIGIVPRRFAYPYGLVNPDAAATVAEFGFELARGIDGLEARK